MNKEEFDYEYTKNVFVSNIGDSYTLNLAMSILEDKQSLIYDNLVVSQNNTNLKQALIDIREICNYYGITPEENDNITLRHILKNVLQIIDKTIGDDER